MSGDMLVQTRAGNILVDDTVFDDLGHADPKHGVLRTVLDITNDGDDGWLRIWFTDHGSWRVRPDDTIIVERLS